MSLLSTNPGDANVRDVPVGLRQLAMTGSITGGYISGPELSISIVVRV